MDSNSTAIIVVAVFALVTIAAFLVFRRRGSVEIKGPLDMGLKLDVSNEPGPAPSQTTASVPGSVGTVQSPGSQPAQAGGVTFAGGNVTVGGDVVGGDKIVYGRDASNARPGTPTPGQPPPTR